LKKYRLEKFIRDHTHLLRHDGVFIFIKVWKDTDFRTGCQSLHHPLQPGTRLVCPLI